MRFSLRNLISRQLIFQIPSISDVNGTTSLADSILLEGLVTNIGVVIRFYVTSNVDLSLIAQSLYPLSPGKSGSRVTRLRKQGHCKVTLAHKSLKLVSSLFFMILPMRPAPIHQEQAGKRKKE